MSVLPSSWVPQMRSHNTSLNQRYWEHSNGPSFCYSQPWYSELSDCRIWLFLHSCQAQDFGRFVEWRDNDPGFWWDMHISPLGLGLQKPQSRTFKGFFKKMKMSIRILRLNFQNRIISKFKTMENNLQHVINTNTDKDRESNFINRSKRPEGILLRWNKMRWGQYLN